MPKSAERHGSWACVAFLPLGGRLNASDLKLRMNLLTLFKTRPRTELIWAGWGALCLALGVLMIAGFGVALYPKFKASSDVRISTDTYASFLGIYKAFFFGVFPAIAFLSGVVAWSILKNLKRIADLDASQ